MHKIKNITYNKKQWDGILNIRPQQHLPKTPVERHPKLQKIASNSMKMTTNSN